MHNCPWQTNSSRTKKAAKLADICFEEVISSPSISRDWTADLIALKSIRGSLKSVSIHLWWNRRWVPLFSAASPYKQLSSRNILNSELTNSFHPHNWKTLPDTFDIFLLLLRNFGIPILSSCLFASTMWPSLPCALYNVPLLPMLLKFPSLPLLLLCHKKSESLCLVIHTISYHSISFITFWSCQRFLPVIFSVQGLKRVQQL